MVEIVVADIGGTHARFALAEVKGGQVLLVRDVMTMRTAEHVSLQLAWQHFGRSVGRPLPRAAAIAVASPVGGEVIKLTNNPWTIRPALIAERLGLDVHVVVNDFGAVAHAVAQLGHEHFRHLCGPKMALPKQGVITIIGPGTGLGVATVYRHGSHSHIIETEGGHIDFAPLDPVEDAMLSRLRARFRRVSVERVVAGSGLVDIYMTLAEIEGLSVHTPTDRALWDLALQGVDALANAALDRFCMSLGSVAGDMALAQGASGVVIAGGLGLRMADSVLRSGFADRFKAKGRFETMLDAIPVMLLTHPQPGLYGAAVSFADRCDIWSRTAQVSTD